jgi:hypothetical protein
LRILMVLLLMLCLRGWSTVSMRMSGMSLNFGVDQSSEAKHPIRCIMGRLISGNVDGVIEYIQSLGNSKDLTHGELAYLLRLSVHIILVMRDLEIQHDQERANEIIAQYVHALMQYRVVCPFNARLTKE